jgi:hypothetical protein
LEFVSGPLTATDSTSLKTATVTCPVGKKVYSAGGNISIVTGSPGKVLLTQVFPSSDLLSVTVQASEDASGFTGTWRLGAFAICGTAVANMTRVKATSQSGAFDGADVSVACPAGRVSYGIGFAINGAPGKIFMTCARRRLSGGNHFADLRSDADDPGVTTPWSMDAFIICGSAALGYEGVFQQSALNSTSPKQMITSCPPPKKVHGVGFDMIVNQAQGDLVIRQMTYDVDATRTSLTVEENDSDPALWRIGNDVICAN